MAFDLFFFFNAAETSREEHGCMMDDDACGAGHVGAAGLTGPVDRGRWVSCPSNPLLRRACWLCRAARRRTPGRLAVHTSHAAARRGCPRIQLLLANSLNVYSQTSPTDSQTFWPFAATEKLPEALFSSKNFWKMDTVALLFVFDKYCPIMD